MGLGAKGKKKRPATAHAVFGPRLQCAGRLKEIMTRHYFLARYVKGARPVAWVTSGAPVELLRAFGFYTLYPENHGALCGAQRLGPEYCGIAEEHGYHQDLCSYARIDLGHLLSERRRWESCPGRICCLPPTISARPCSTGIGFWPII